MFKKVKAKFSQAWEWLKVKFYRSQAILVARIQSITGFLVAALSAADWGPIVGAATGAGLTRAQAITLGLVLFFQGVVAEWARRVGTKQTKEGNLIPVELEVKKAK